MDRDDRDDVTTNDRTTNDLTISEVPISDVAQDTVAVDVLREGTAVVAVLAGEIDSLTGPAAQATVTGLVIDGRAQLLVIDLSAVTFLSSRGIALLVDIADLARTRSVEVRVVTGTGRVVLRPLEITGLDTVLALFRTRAEALATTSKDVVVPGEEPGLPI